MFFKKKHKPEPDPELERLIDELAEKINQNEMRFWQALEILKKYFKDKEVEKNGNDSGIQLYLRNKAVAEKNNFHQAQQ